MSDGKAFAVETRSMDKSKEFAFYDGKMAKKKPDKGGIVLIDHVSLVELFTIVSHT